MKRMFYIGKDVKELKEIGLIYCNGIYETDEAIDKLYVGRKHNKKRLVYFGSTSFHIDLGYDEAFFNFVKANSSISGFKTKEGFYNYAICKNKEVVTSVEELRSKSLNHLKEIRAKEKDLEKAMVVNWKTNPYIFIHIL